VPRPFIAWPHKVLRQHAAPVEAITDETRAIWDEMIDAMEAMPGVGLAAVQLGIPLRLAVVDASRDRGQAVRMANPEILHASIERRDHDEASPNLPGVSAVIARPRAVTARFLNAQGEIEEAFTAAGGNLREALFALYDRAEARRSGRRS